MKLAQIEQVLEVARVGSISQAAENLYVSQPNLSLSIKRLETEIGTELFMRTGSGVSLTWFGKKFVEQAQQIMAEVGTLEDMCRSRNVMVPLELKIGTQGRFNCGEILSELFRKYGENAVEIRWYDMNLSAQIQALKNGDIEIGIITLVGFHKKAILQKIISQGLEYHRIAPSRRGIYVGINDPRFPEDKVSVMPEDLEGMPIVLLPTQESSAPYFSEEGFVFPNKGWRIYVDDLGTLREAINSVNGYSFATYSPEIHHDGSTYPDVRFIPFANQKYSAEVGCILNRRIPHSVLAEEFLSYMTLVTC